MALYDFNLFVDFDEELARERAAERLGVTPDDLGAASVAALWGISVDDAAQEVRAAIDRELMELRAERD